MSSEHLVFLSKKRGWYYYNPNIHLQPSDISKKPDNDRLTSAINNSYPQISKSNEQSEEKYSSSYPLQNRISFNPFEKNFHSLTNGSPTGLKKAPSKAPSMDSVDIFRITGHIIIDNDWINNCEKESDLNFLHICVIKNKINDLKLFLKQSSNTQIKKEVLKKDKRGLSPLHWAALLGHKKIVQEIFQNIDPEDRLECFYDVDLHGWSFLHMAIKKNDESFIRTCCNFLSAQDLFILLTYQYSNSDSILHLSIHNNIKTINDLIFDPSFDSFREKLFQSKTSSGQTIFHLAASSGDSHLFKNLMNCINKNKRSEILQIKDNLGRTPLHLAACIKNNNYIAIEIIETILNNIFIDKQKYLAIQDVDGRTPLHYSMINQNELCTTYLLNDEENIKDYLMILDNLGKTALHCLFYENDAKLRSNKLFTILQIIKERFEKNQAEKVIKDLLYIKDNEGKTFLHYIALLIDEIMLEMIINEFSNDDELFEYFKTKDKLGQTFLHCFTQISDKAFSGVHPNILLNNITSSRIIFLDKIKKKNDRLNLLLKEKDIFNKTPIHNSARNLDDDSTTKFMFESISKDSKFSYLSETLDDAGNTLLHFLVQINKISLLIYLLQDLNEEDRLKFISQKNLCGENIFHIILKYQIKISVEDFLTLGRFLIPSTSTDYQSVPKGTGLNS